MVFENILNHYQWACLTRFLSSENSRDIQILSGGRKKMNKKILSLHERALQAVDVYKNAEAELISILQELDEYRGYLHFEASSLYDYCLRILKLSDDVACNLIAVARKSRDIPALKEAIEKKEITLSKARKIVSVLNRENQEEWLELARTETSRVIEKAVATENPQLLIKESVRYRSEDRIELKMGISEELLKKLERICDLESQKQAKSVSREDALSAAAGLYLEKNDPLRKAERSKTAITYSKTEVPNGESVQGSTTQRAAKFVPGRVTLKNRPHIPAAVSHAIALRDQRQCTHVTSDGERCKNTRWLEIHHVQPKSLGGCDALDNLTTLCSSHHGFLHREEGFVRADQAVGR